MASPAAKAAAQYEATAASFVKEHRLPSAAAGVVHGDELVWAGGAGHADRSSGRAADARTLYRIASVTKTVTATAVMQLRDEGRLALDDPAVVHLPELADVRSAHGPVENLTIRRMLSHESGLQSEPPGTDWAAVAYEDDPLRNLARASEIGLTVPPNSQWKYSNLAYQLLGEIVSRVSGTPYPKYIRQRILRPLGMASTSLDPLPARLSARRATGYEPRFLSDELELAPEETAIFGADGGLWSCVDDLARWLSCQLADEPAVLSRASLDEMHRPRYLTDDAWTRAWGIGWYARRQDDVIWITHSGAHYGFSSNVCFERTHRVGAITLVNGVGDASELALQLGEIARGEIHRAAPPIDVPPALPIEWRPYLGLYLGRHFGTVARVEWIDGKLTVVDPDDPTSRPTLVATDEPDVFAIDRGFRESGELARFERDETGQVVSLFFAAARLQRLEPVST